MIQIVDDFLNKENIERLQKFVRSGLQYEWRETDDKAHYGFRTKLSNHPDLLEILKKQTEDTFKIKIKEVSQDCGIDMRKMDKFYPHQDVRSGTTNLMLMIDGLVANSNGIVFYSNNELDIHVGFRPNRAVLFPSNWIHSSNVCAESKSLPRYTATLFITKL